MSFSETQKSINAQVKSPLKKIVSATVLSTLGTMLCFAPNTFAQQLSGVVLNKQGQPINNATVGLNGDSQQVRTNAQGIFNFTDVNKGIFELHISAKNYGHSNQHVIMKEEDITDLSVVLSTSVMEVIDVHATPLHTSSIESALPINVLSEDELKMKQAATLGETLKNEVGVHSSYYGPVASTPIIRGLDGPRVLITQNGLDVGDASRVGPDHVVATETSTATQIEVLRGPATLFYGSGAIGGVVNVVDNRVPTSSDEQVDYLLQYNDVSNEQQASVNIQTGTNNIAVHVDAFWRDSKDYKLAGEADIHEEDHEEEHEDHGGNRLANSSSTASGATLGSSYLFEDGFIGFSYGFMDREYGIPGHSHEEEQADEHSAADHDEAAGVYAKMKQDRWQVLGEYNFEQQFISKVATKFAYSDYQHQEIESGLVGTTFTNKSTEARIDLFHQNIAGWQGAWTVHYKSSDFKALGEEAFSPPAKSEMFAVAWLEEKHFGPVLLQLGARVEQVNIDADDSLIGFEDSHQDQHESHTELSHNEHHQTLVSFDQQSFTPISASVGLVWNYQPGYNLGFSTALSQRAASSGELFSFGPHIGTNTFEVGAMFDVHQEGDELHVELAEQTPSVETSLNFDVTLRKFNGDFGYVISAFYNRIDDYYYQQDTGLFFVENHAHAGEHENELGLPILVYQQDDVEMYGAEAEFIYQVSSAFKTSLIADYIRARLVNEDENDNLPRIPPMRIGAIFNYQADKFDSELSVSHYFEQDDVAELETNTDSYTMVDANFNYYIDGVGDDLTVYLKAQNLTDEHARVHSSFLKEVAPLPGRNFSVGIRGSF